MADHLAIVEASFRQAISDSFSYAPPAEVAVTMSDLHSHLVQVCTAGVRILAEVARGRQIPTDDLQSMLAIGQGSGYAAASVGRLQRENAQLRRENMEMRQIRDTLALRELTLEQLRNDLKSYETDMKTKEEQAKEMEERISSLEQKRHRDRKQRAKLEQDLREQMKLLQDENVYFKKFVDEQIPGRYTEGFNSCQEVYLKKILGRYPDADMRYFANVKDVPEGIEILDDWFPEEPLADAAEAETEDVADPHETETVADLTETVQGAPVDAVRSAIPGDAGTGTPVISSETSPPEVPLNPAVGVIE